MQDLKGQLIDFIDYGNDGLEHVIARGLVIDVKETDHYLIITTLVKGAVIINECGAPECGLFQTSDGYQIYNNYAGFGLL